MPTKIVMNSPKESIPCCACNKATTTTMLTAHILTKCVIGVPEADTALRRSANFLHLSVEFSEAFLFIVVCTVDLHHTLAAVSLTNHISQIGQCLLKILPHSVEYVFPTQRIIKAKNGATTNDTSDSCQL